MSFAFPRSALCAAPAAAMLLAACSTAGLPTPGASQGKLLLTGGVTSIDGAAGGGLTPWAVTGSYATNGEVGATASATRVSTQEFALTGYAAAVTYKDRVEVSIAKQDFDAGVVVPQARLKLDILGLKVKVAGDAVLDSDSLMPQIAVGIQAKHLNPGAAVGGVLDSVAAKRSGTDLYVSATKLFLRNAVLVNATLRATKANQNGLLGFGSADKRGYSLQPEVSLALLLSKNIAVGVEYRAKPDNLSFAGAAFKEDDWKDVFVAWAPNKHLSVTAAYVDLGNIVGNKRQKGGYLSAQFAF